MAMLYKLFIAYLVLINLIAFCAYGVDKSKAKKKKWRIPEITLLSLAFAGGALGAWCGMYAFRHKTKKRKFVIGVPMLLLVQIGIGIGLRWV